MSPWLEYTLTTKFTLAAAYTHSSLVDQLVQVIYAKNCPTTLLHFPIGMGSYDHHEKY